MVCKPRPRQPAPLSAVLAALADPVRLAIVQRLAAGCANCATAAPSGLPKSTQSFHYKVLREAGLIVSQRQGQEVINTLKRDEIDARFPGLLDAILTSACSDQTAARSDTA
jgi:DNA-binding transcriptional ArsR family regulator